MQVRNIRPFSQYVPGDVVEVPDGSATDPFYWEAVGGEGIDIQVIPDVEPPVTLSPAAVSVPPAPAAPDPAPADPPRLPYPAKEM